MSELINNIQNKLSESAAFQGAVFSDASGTLKIEVPKENYLDAGKVLKDEFGFDQLRDVVGVDRFTKEKRFETIANIYSTVTHSRVFLSARLDSKNPEVESLTSLWPSANWYERESFDLVGIKYLNHPDLRRIYMMEEYEYYPLRKDYPLMGLPGSVQLPKK